MNRLPTIDPPATDEPLQTYGCRVLRFVLEHGCTATLSDADLELADHVYPIAVSAPELSGAVLQRLTNTRHQILACLDWRRREAKREQPRAPQSEPPKPGGQPGKYATLQPAPIVRPPAGVAIDVRF